MNWPAAIAVGVVACVLGAVVGYSVARNKPVELQLKQGERSASLKIGNDGAIDYEKVLGTFFENGHDWLRGAAKTWLLEKQGIVSISESQLAQLLEDKACGDFKVAVVQPARSSEEYFKDLENRSRCANLPSVSALRSLPREGKPPFHTVMETMNATIPRPDAIPKVGTVNICKSRRELDGVKIELVSPNRVDSSQLLPIVLLARARMDCGEQSFTAMHLRPEDATKLTGEEHPNMPVAIYFSRVV